MDWLTKYLPGTWRTKYLYTVQLNCVCPSGFSTCFLFPSLYHELTNCVYTCILCNYIESMHCSDISMFVIEIIFWGIKHICYMFYILYVHIVKFRRNLTHEIILIKFAHCKLSNRHQGAAKQNAPSSHMFFLLICCHSCWRRG